MELVNLIAANIGFVGTHFAMSHPLRAGIVRAIGETGFQIAYSLVSILMLVWVYFAFIAAPAGDLSGSGNIGWAIATALTLPAMVLLAGSMFGNPALPTPMAKEQARAQPQGVFKVTRHPMMWAFGLWALSHIVIHVSWRTTITAFAMGVLALVGARLQDAKKRALMGEAWVEWESKTSYWPRVGAMVHAGAFAWATGLVLFFLLTWLHIPAAGIEAGLWRWF